MDLAFTSITPITLQGSFARGQVCARPSAPSNAVSRTSLPRMAVRDPPPPLESVDLPSGLPDASVAVLDEGAGDGVSVVDIGDDTEYDFDESEIIPCAPPKPIVNAQAVAAIREQFRLHENDSGSSEYQIATLTARINYLTEHLKNNRKDYSSTRGLLRMVSTRRKLLKFVKREDPKRFDRLVTELNIRVSQELRNV